jgi:hypothetical protein
MQPPRNRGLALALLAAVCVVPLFVACRSLCPDAPSAPTSMRATGTLANPTTVSDWYFTSAALGGNDGATCSQNAPCVTISGGMIPKIGVLGSNGQLGQTWGTAAASLVVTLHIQGSETAGQELALLTPTLLGKGTTLAIICTPQPVGTPFTAGTVTAPSKVNPGSETTIAAFPTAGLAGMLVTKTAQGDGGVYTPSAALVQTVSTSHVATMDPPHTLASLTTVTMNPTPVEDTTWATGDTLQLATLPILNLESMTVRAGDTDGTNGGLFIEGCEIPDQSGSNATSNFTLASRGGGLVASLTKFDANTKIDSSSSTVVAQVMASQFEGAAVFAGAVNVSGGSLFGAAAAHFSTVTMQNDVNVAGGFSVKGGANVSLGSVYCASTMSAVSGTYTLTAAGLLWGACTVNLSQPLTSFYSLGDASTLLASLYIAGLDAGVGPDGAAAVFTPAKLDTAGAVLNGNSGSRFTH